MRENPNRAIILYLLVFLLALAALIATLAYVKAAPGASLTLRLYLDTSRDGQPQTDEPAVGGHLCTWTPIDPAKAGAFTIWSDAAGYVVAELVPGDWLLSCTGVEWPITVGDVAGAAVVDVPVTPSVLWLPMAAGGGQ